MVEGLVPSSAGRVGASMLVDYWRLASTGRPKVRVGLLVDDLSVERWIAEIIGHIRTSEIADVVIVVQNGEAAAKPACLPFGRRLSNRLRDPQFLSCFLFRQYRMLDGARVPPAVDPQRPVSVGELLGDVPVMPVVPIREGPDCRFRPEAAAALVALNLDVLLCFGFGTLKGDVLRAAKHGAWSFHHDDNEFYRGGPPCLWELFEEDPLTGVVLEQLAEDRDSGRILKKALFETELGLSVSRNRVRPFWGATHLAMQALHELHRDGRPRVEGPSPAYHGRRSVYSTPTNMEMVRWLAPRLTASAVRRLSKPRTLEHWRIAIRVGGDRAIRLGDEIADLQGFRILEAPPGRSWADPFLIRHGGETWIFYEEFDYAKGRASIACRNVGEAGDLGDPIRCLDKGYHLSYPHVFAHQGEVFMIPESSENGTVDLYRAVSFPDRWALEKTLFRDRAVDTTVWMEGDLVWFFTSIAPRHGKGRLLYLFHSDELTGDWRYHPANPISCDARSCRGAGAIFRKGGVLFRPSQDSRWTYGHSLAFNRIDELSPEGYRETRVLEVGPSWAAGLLGTHTYNAVDNVEVLDCKIASARSRHGR
jgi:hypothetical protein